MSTMFFRISILVLALAGFSGIKAGTCSTKMKNQCTKNTPLKPEASPPPEQEAAPSNAITYDQWSRLNTEIMSRVLAYLKPKELRISFLSSSKENDDFYINELREAVLRLTTDKTFRSRFPDFVWIKIPPKIKGKKVLEDAWSYVNFSWIAKKFGEILNDNVKTADEKIAEMNELYSVIKEQNRYAERRLEMIPSHINPIMRVWLDLLIYNQAANAAYGTNYILRDMVYPKILSPEWLQSMEFIDKIRDLGEDQTGHQMHEQIEGLVINQFRGQLGDKAWFQLRDEIIEKSLGQIVCHQITNQVRNQIENQARAFFEKLGLQQANINSENLGSDISSALRVTAHYAFLVFQLYYHFVAIASKSDHVPFSALDYSFLNNLDIPSDFADFVPTLKESIKTQLSLLGDDGTDFPIRNGLQRMLDHFPNEE